MKTINTKAELLQEMRRLGACKEATEWVTAEEGTADEIWRRCTDVSWLIWFAGRNSPTAISAFAGRCAERAKGYDAASVADADAAAAWAALAARAADYADYAARAADYAEYAESDDAERALQLSDLHQLLPSRPH
jgi:hypothetical protein